MDKAIYKDLGQGITCIDANYSSHGLACFYLLEHQGACAIIETGTAHSIANLQQCMADKKLDPSSVKYVIPTHVHLDHAGGAGAMMALFPEATLVVHPKGARHLIDPSRLIASSIAVYGERAYTALYGELIPVESGRVREAQDKHTLHLSGRALHIRHTPGHADHHFCLWDELSRGWFTGDMFGVSYETMRFEKADFVMVSTTPTQFRPEAFIESVNLLSAYSPSRMYLTHYGELAYTEKLARLLCQQIAAYREFAPEYVGQTVALAQRIIEYTLECMRPFDPPGGEAANRKLVELDAQLNAQGLEVWLNRMKITAQGT